MGIRFACHVCERRLNIKRELAGRRGICPVCGGRIRIPLTDAEKSTPVDEPLVTAHRSGKADRSANADPGNGDSGGDSDHFPSAIDLLSDEPDGRWYVRPPGGGQYGPADAELLKQWISEGRVASDALLWREGWPQWRQAIEVLPEYGDRLPAAGIATASTNATPTDRDDIEPIASEATVGRRSADEGEILAKRARAAKTKRLVMTISLLSVLALTLILVVVLAVSG